MVYAFAEAEGRTLLLTFFLHWLFLFAVAALLHVYLFFAVFLERLNAAAVGAPLLPGLRIRSPLPAAIRLRFAWMFAYSPGFFAITNSCKTSSAE